MSEPTIDRVTFDALRDTTGAEFVVELVQTFVDEAPGVLAEMRRARQAGDAEAFRRNAHSLKSNARTFGAPALAAMARDLETGGLERAAAAGGAPLDALEAEYARVAAALKALCHA